MVPRKFTIFELFTVNSQDTPAPDRQHADSGLLEISRVSQQKASCVRNVITDSKGRSAED